MRATGDNDLATNRLAAERLSDGARTVFDGDYLTEHITLGYATTVHAAQGVTTDTCHAILGEGASRSMAYVAMTRGRHTNNAYLYQKLNHEADHHHATPIAAPQIHQLHRGTKSTAAQAFRTLLANDDRPTTMQAHAEHTPTELLPDIVAETLERNQQRRSTRRTVWKEHLKTIDAWRTGYQRIAAATTRSAEIFVETGGLEL
ncbi:helicase C-terminal domain-containing protein [Mycobacterium sp. JS623]|uniref:helicase C-terminal domain-containing protein n=1 Tax=Mycobacterium sp. JS623 TaxID=212767 RepID=UPI0018E0157C|nr:helicase C-terminal domain-containing protein [Mycobacterium sp. JS623]